MCLTCPAESVWQEDSKREVSWTQKPMTSWSIEMGQCWKYSELFEKIKKSDKLLSGVC